MIDRYREKVAFESLRDLILHMGADPRGTHGGHHRHRGLGALQAEQTLTDLRKDPVTGRPVDGIPGTPPPVGVGPGGALTANPQPYDYDNGRQECDRDQMELAMTERRSVLSRPLSRTPIAPTSASILSIRAGCRRSIAISARVSRCRRHSTAPSCSSASTRCGFSPRIPTGRAGQQQRSRQADAAPGRGSASYLPDRLLLDEREARWGIPDDQGERLATPRGSTGAPRLPGGERR